MLVNRHCPPVFSFSTALSPHNTYISHRPLNSSKYFVVEVSPVWTYLSGRVIWLQWNYQVLRICSSKNNTNIKINRSMHSLQSVYAHKLRNKCIKSNLPRTKYYTLVTSFSCEIKCNEIDGFIYQVPVWQCLFTSDTQLQLPLEI